MKTAQQETKSKPLTEDEIKKRELELVRELYALGGSFHDMFKDDMDNISLNVEFAERFTRNTRIERGYNDRICRLNENAWNLDSKLSMNINEINELNFKISKANAVSRRLAIAIIQHACFFVWDKVDGDLHEVLGVLDTAREKTNRKISISPEEAGYLITEALKVGAGESTEESTCPNPRTPSTADQ
jgi:hypothetical protein